MPAAAPSPPRARPRSPGRAVTSAWALGALLVWGAAGCAHGARAGHRGPLPLSTLHTVSGSQFVLEHVEADTAVLDRVREALDGALPRVALWGELRWPVHVRIQPDHAALEAAANRHGYPWLRAWARYDEILLQSPATHGLFERGSGRLRELVAHELTHCLMYQLVAEPWEWRRRDRQIPLWFREGMASWTAGQGHRRMRPEALAEWIARTGRDPLGDADRLYQKHMAAVYGAAHHAFAQLVAEYGEGAVRGILQGLRAGASFDQAFRAYTGQRRQAFETAVVEGLARDGDRVSRRTPAAGPTTAAGAPEDARRPSAGAGAPPR